VPWNEPTSRPCFGIDRGLRPAGRLRRETENRGLSAKGSGPAYALGGSALWKLRPEGGQPLVGNAAGGADAVTEQLHPLQLEAQRPRRAVDPLGDLGTADIEGTPATIADQMLM